VPIAANGLLIPLPLIVGFSGGRGMNAGRKIQENKISSCLIVKSVDIKRVAVNVWILLFVISYLTINAPVVNARTALQDAQVQGVNASWSNIAAAMSERQLMPIERALFDRLDEVLQTVMGMSANGVGLGLSDANSVDAALQQVAGEEVTSFGSSLTDSSYSQMNTIVSRFAQLRGGAGGLTVASSGSNSNIPGLMSMRGGSAGADGLVSGGRLGSFFNVAIATGEVDGTDKENAYDYDTYGAMLGVDYRITPSLVLGIAAGYSDLDSSFQHEAVVAGGGVTADGYSLSLYSTFYRGAFYIDGIVSYGSNDYEMNRRVFVPLGAGSAATQADWDLTANAITESDQHVLGLGVGYEINLGATSLSPYLRLNYMESQIDGYQETGAGAFEFIVDRYEVDSLVAVAGVSATHVVNTRFGAVIPQARIAWAHEHQNDTDTLHYRYVWEAVPSGGSPWVFPIESEEPDRDYFVFGLGASGVFTRGAQLFVDYQTVVGRRRISEHVITGGVRLEF